MEPVLYDIKDAARYLGVAPSTLRYWEREGLVRAGRNRGNDYRQYALHDLIDASEIAFYRRLGVPVRELAGYRTLSARDLDDALDRTAPGTVFEMVADTPTRAGAVWERDAPGAGEGRECLLLVDPDDPNRSNAPALFAEAARQGLEPRLAVGTYLLTAVEEGPHAAR